MASREMLLMRAASELIASTQVGRLPERCMTQQLLLASSSASTSLLARGWLRTHTGRNLSAAQARLFLTNVPQRPRHCHQERKGPKYGCPTTRSASDAAKSASPAENAHVSPPASPLTILFTDIVSSSYLWEHHPQSMASAMRTHDRLLRQYMGVHSGYEVKQNGDGFMIAFQHAVDALAFCLDVQCKLVDPEEGWPQDLLRDGQERDQQNIEGLGAEDAGEVRLHTGDSLVHARQKNASGSGDATQTASPTSSKDKIEDNGNLIFRGLRLRMSLHCGTAVMQHNPVIDRMDYLGPMVNRAARFIQVTEPGQIVVSEELLRELKRAKVDGPLFAVPLTEGVNQVGDLRDLRVEGGAGEVTRFEVRLLGERHFKGVEGPQRLYFIVPETLKGRLHFWPRGQHIAGSKGNLV